MATPNPPQAAIYNAPNPYTDQFSLVADTIQSVSDVVSGARDLLAQQVQSAQQTIAGQAASAISQIRQAVTAGTTSARSLVGQTSQALSTQISQQQQQASAFTSLATPASMLGQLSGIQLPSGQALQLTAPAGQSQPSSIQLPLNPTQTAPANLCYNPNPAPLPTLQPNVWYVLMFPDHFSVTNGTGQPPTTQPTITPMLVAEGFTDWASADSWVGQNFGCLFRDNYAAFPGGLQVSTWYGFRQPNCPGCTPTQQQLTQQQQTATQPQVGLPSTGTQPLIGQQIQPSTVTGPQLIQPVQIGVQQQQVIVPQQQQPQPQQLIGIPRQQPQPQPQQTNQPTINVSCPPPTINVSCPQQQVTEPPPPPPQKTGPISCNCVCPKCNEQIIVKVNPKITVDVKGEKIGIGKAIVAPKTAKLHSDGSWEIDVDLETNQDLSDAINETLVRISTTWQETLPEESDKSQDVLVIHDSFDTNL